MLLRVLATGAVLLGWGAMIYTVSTFGSRGLWPKPWMLLQPQRRAEILRQIVKATELGEFDDEEAYRIYGRAIGPEAIGFRPREWADAVRQISSAMAEREMWVFMASFEDDEFDENEGEEWRGQE